MAKVFNPAAVPVQATSDGRSVGGGDWAELVPDEMTEALIASGALVVVAALPGETPTTKQKGA